MEGWLIMSHIGGGYDFMLAMYRSFQGLFGVQIVYKLTLNIEQVMTSCAIWHSWE